MPNNSFLKTLPKCTNYFPVSLPMSFRTNLLCHFNRSGEISFAKGGKVFSGRKMPSKLFSSFLHHPLALGSGRGRTGLSLFAREASHPAGSGLRILRRRCRPFRNTVAGPPETCRPGTVFGVLLHIAFQVCGTLGHLKRSAAPPRHHKNRKKNIRIVKTCIRANPISGIFVYFCGC